MPPNLQTFPTELLTEIYKDTESAMHEDAPYADAVMLSHVCRHWRGAAIGASELWLDIGIIARDARHLEFVTEYFQRSKGRDIGIWIDFSETAMPGGERSVFLSLLNLISPHLRRASQLSIVAQWQAWSVISVVFERETYPNLSLLDAQVVEPPVVRGRQRAVWLPPPAAGGGTPSPIAVRRAPHPPITFHFPPQHPLLDRVRVAGITLANAASLNLVLIRITGDQTPNLLGRDGRLERWLLDGPISLYFENMPIPAMLSYVPEDIPARKVPTTTHLILSGLRGTPRSSPDHTGSREHDCMPFFDALYTPAVRCLQIDRWDPSSRAWKDFLDWLPEDIRFPCLLDLRITGMGLEHLDDEDLAFFLASFPRLRHLRLEDCPPGTWERVLGALQMDETLCPGVKLIRLREDLVVLRADPLPFPVASMVAEE